MMSFEKYLYDREKRLFEINDICSVKEPAVLSTKNINEVQESY